MNRAVRLRVWPGLVTVTALLAAQLLLAWDAASQSRLPSGQPIAAEPTPNAILAGAPDEIALTFAMSLNPESANIRLVAPGGVDIALQPARVDPEAPARMQTRPVEPVGGGAYTVLWSAQAAEDGALMAGAYPFRVGVTGAPGAAAGPEAWPAPWAALLRWLAFLGTAIAGGGFAWERLLAARPARRGSGGRERLGAMTVAALLALLAAAATPVLARYFSADASSALLAITRSMPQGWRVQIAALVVLGLLCLGLFVRGDAPTRGRASFDWLGIGASGLALVGLGLTSHAASPLNAVSFGIEVVHLWSTALWFSVVLFFLAGWRGLGTDVARFRAVRWVGGLLLAISIAAGLAQTAHGASTLGDLATGRYAQVLAGKMAAVLTVVVLGGLAVLGRGGANAIQASRFLGGQALCAGVAALLAAVLALTAPPGTAAPATLAGVALGDVVPLDRAAFAAERGVVHILMQPVMPGAQTVVVRLTAADGMPFSVAPPKVEMTETLLEPSTQSSDPVALRADASGALFTGAIPLAAGWRQIDVAIIPPGGVASRVQFWLVVPDPNVAGTGPRTISDPEAMALYERGLAALTALRSVRFAQRLGDGSGSFSLSEVAVSAAEGERPAAFAETVSAADGEILAQQTILGNRRWRLVNGVWAIADSLSFQVPAVWGERYAGADGFQLGPREAVGGELSQVVMFRVPARDGLSGAPAWCAWWVGLASGQVRREVMISAGRYTVSEFRDFNAELGIEPPDEDGDRRATPTAAEGSFSSTITSDS